MYFIYKIINIINNKIYIGQTNYPELRWSQHKSNAKYNRGGQVITRALIKYGINNFTFEVIATCKTQEDIDFIEELIIVQYDSRNPEKGYNVDIGGRTSPRSKIILTKISNSLREYYKTHSNWNKGGTLSQEWKDNISKNSMGKPGTNLGKTFSKEWSLNIGKSNIGVDRKSKRRFSEEIEKEICRLYVEEERSTYYLGNKFNCGRALILTILFRNNIEIRKSNYTGHFNNRNLFTKEKEKEISNKYLEGIYTIVELSKIYGCGRATLREVLLRNDINLKSGKRGTDEKLE